MKVIFLDVDGVLNCTSTKETIGGRCKFVEDRKIEILKEIVECTDARIVLSSTWRLGWIWKDEDPNSYDEFYEGLVRKLNEHGLTLYDKTKQLGTHRGREIDEWLSRHPDTESFVILDDESDMDEHIGRLVKTRWYATGAGGGLMRKHIRLAIELLNKPYIRK